MRKCAHCNRELSDKAVVCVKCGYLQTETGHTAVKALPPAETVYADQGIQTAPVGQLKTNRGLFKFIFLSLITFGIYGIVVMSAVSTDINCIAGRYDGKRTMHYCWVYFILSWLTLGIVPIVWLHKLSGRIGRELQRRRISYSFGAGSYWGWCVLGSLILVGPMVYIHKLLKSMNLLAEHYNING